MTVTLPCACLPPAGVICPSLTVNLPSGRTRMPSGTGSCPICSWSVAFLPSARLSATSWAATPWSVSEPVTHLTAELHAVAAGDVDVADELVLLADLGVDAAVLDREVVLLAVGVPQREAAAAGRRGGAGRLAALLADRADQVADAARAAGDRGALVVEARVAAVGVDRRDDPLGLAGALDDVRALDGEAVADVLVAGQEDVAGEARRRVPRHERGERAVADLALEREPRRGRRPGARPWGGLRIVAVRGPREHRADHSPEPGIRGY